MKIMLSCSRRVKQTTDEEEEEEQEQEQEEEMS